MIAKVHSISLVGMDGYPVEVEVAVAQGLPAFSVVGLPDVAIQESRERVRAAVQSSGEKWPMQRITVNLSPAHLRKAGSSFDLAIALAVLCAAGRIRPERLTGVCVLGELGLDGAVRGVRGVLSAALAAGRAGMTRIVVPARNGSEASLVEGVEVLAVRSLAEAVGVLRGEASPSPLAPSRNGTAPAGEAELADVRGQVMPKAALEVAAAGGHNLLMVGPPGAGKTMLARRLPGILPPLALGEAFEVTRIHSIAGLLEEDVGLVRVRPFRAPHHSVSTAGLIGGGSGLPQPGEVSLSHRGVLFLDECAEFRRDAIQAMRGPLEDGHVTIVRAGWSVTYPSRFQLVAATNPCPCGFRGDPVRACECLPHRVAAYRERLSGPIMDRIDLQVSVEPVSRRDLFGAPQGPGSAEIRASVVAAREIQTERLRPHGWTCNAEVSPSALQRTCRLTPSAWREIGEAVERAGLSARAAHRAVRVARTIADLAGDECVDTEHVAHALGYRITHAAE